MFEFLSSTSAAVKIIEFLLDKTIWKYFDKEKSSKSIESRAGLTGRGQVLLLQDLTLREDILKSSSIELISIKELRFSIESIQNIQVSVDSVLVHVRENRSRSTTDPTLDDDHDDDSDSPLSDNSFMKSPNPLSSSIHFAGDFIRNELDSFEDEEKERTPLPGLADLAKTIDTIIGKAKLVIRNVVVKVFAPTSDDFLELSVQELKLKDHVAEDFDIPSELLGQDIDILSFIVKYLVATETIVSFHPSSSTFNPPSTSIPILKIPLTWARILFSQQDFPLSGSPDTTASSQSNPSSAALFSDLKLKMFAYGIVSIVRARDLQEIASLFLNSPTSPVSVAIASQISQIASSMDSSMLDQDDVSLLAAKINAAELPPSPGPPLSLTFFCNDASICLLPSSTSPPTLETYESFSAPVPSSTTSDPFWTSQHLLLSLEKIKFSKQDKVFTLTSKEFALKEYLPTSSYEYIVRPLKQGEFGHDFRDEPAIQIDYFDGSLGVHVQSVYVDLKLETMKRFGAYFSPSPVHRENGGASGGGGGYVDVEIGHTVIAVDLSSDDANPARIGAFVEVRSLALEKEKENANWKIETSEIIVGLFPLQSPQSTTPLFTLSRSTILLSSNKPLYGGLTEELMNFRHDLCRESVSFDSMSTKSWSDVDNGSDIDRLSPRDLPLPIPQPTKNDLLDPSLLNSKYVVDVKVEQAEGFVSADQFGKVKWLLETIQKLNAKNPPEPTQFPITVILSIPVLKITISGAEAESCHIFTVSDIDGVIALASAGPTKNISMVDIFCSKVAYESTLKSKNKWRFLDQASNPKRAMVHLLLSQCEDLDIEVRQMKLTSCINDAFVHLPDLITDIVTPIPAQTDIVEDNGQESSVCTFLDLVVAFSSCSMTHSSKDGQHAVFKADSFKLSSNLISASPTKGYVFSLFNANTLVGINPELRAYFQNETEMSHTEISRLRCFPVISVDTLRVDVRTNQPGVLPASDFNVAFNQITLETCSDSRNALLAYFASFSPKAVDDDRAKASAVEESFRKQSSGPAISIDTFDSVDETAFENKPSISRNTSFDIETEELEDEHEWHMDFESTYTKEEVLTEKVTIFPSATRFSLNPQYMNQLPPLATGILDTAKIQFSISEGNVSVRLYPGNDFAEGNETEVFKRQPYQLELHMLKISLQFYLYPDETQYARAIYLKIRDVEVFDRVPKSKFRKFFCFQTPDTHHQPRETDSDMIDITFEAVRVEKEELRLKVKLLPVELHIDQDLIMFLETFFENSSSPVVESPEKTSPATINDPSFFQYVEISPISIQVDYKPKHVDYSSIKQGELMQLINFIHLDEAKIFLNGIKIAGVHGWHRLMRRVIAIWLPHVRSTQLPQMASGIAGMKTLANLGSGIADLVLLPIEQYQKDGKIFKGLSRGTKSFLKATTKETVRIGSQLATGAQFILEKAETKSRITTEQQMPNQPQVIPANLLRPVIRFTGTIADALVKLSDTLDGNSGSSNSKYKGR